MRTDVLRWSGISALLFAAAFIASTAFIGASGVDGYIDDNEIEVFLEDVRDKNELFLGSLISSLVSAVFLVGLLPGLFYSVREQDRPYAVVSGVFFCFGAMFAAISSLFGIMLSDTGAYFAASGAVREAIGRDALQLLNTQNVFFWGVPAGIGLLIAGVLILRSAFYHKAVGWLAIIAGLGGVSAVGWFIILPGMLIWSLAFAWYMLRPRARASMMAPAPA